MTIISKQPSLQEKIKSFIDEKILKKGPLDQSQLQQEQEQDQFKPKPEIADYIAGEIADFKEDYAPYLPVELIAGEVPYIAGFERDTVWNAASQACGTEKVNFTYAVDVKNDKVTYLACPTSTLASNPDSWCPLVAALPGNPEFIDKQTVYVYEQDASTAAMRWSEETNRIQLFVGASRTILPKIQSMDTNFVTIGQDNPHVIPWKNTQLKTEKLARALIRAITLSGIALSSILLVILMFSSLSLTFTKKDLSQLERDNKKASTTLIETSYKAMHSDILSHNVRVQQLIDDLPKFDGTLVKYEVSKGKVIWEALINDAFIDEAKKLGALVVAEENKNNGERKRIRGTK
jgi:hypothetical protein